MACLAILCFLVFSFPYLRLLREETGRWAISKKFAISVGSFSDDELIPVESFTRTKKITLVSLVKEPLTVLKKIVLGWFQALYMFTRGFHPVLFLLAVLGFAWSIRGASSKKGTLYLFSHFIFYFGLLLPFFWIWRRYTSLLSALALPWASLGFISLTGWITPRLKEGRWRTRFPALFLLFIVSVIFIQGRVVHDREHRVIQREIGLWMKDHLPKEGKVMSRLPHETFYAEMDWVRMPENNYEEILQIARSKNVDYVIVDDRVLSYVPDFQAKAKDKRELEELFELTREGRSMILFKLIRPLKEQ
jgi:hypothetical protein